MNKKTQIVTCMLALVSVWAFMASGPPPVEAKGPQRPLSGPPDPTHRVLAGSDWLGGRGVDVFYLNRNQCTSSCEPARYGGGVNGSCPFQCVDLAVRLYDKVGYKNFRVPSGRGYRLIQSAYELQDFAQRKSKPRDDPEDELRFYPNDGTATRPPAPGDLLVYAGASSNGYAGHVAVVNWVAGDTLEFVQQNMCYGGQPQPRGEDFIDVRVVNGQQRFTVSDQSVLGWVHSKRIKEQLIDQKDIRRVGDISWNRDDTAVYVYLSPERTRAAARGEYLTGVVGLLASDGALHFTSDSLAYFVTNQVAEWIRNDARLNPRNGVRSVDFTLKYTGRVIWVRPWGGPANGRWISLMMPALHIEPRFTGVREVDE
ncbi:MAG: CHAP domain-containing protein [Anaerolineae bacterium]